MDDSTPSFWLRALLWLGTSVGIFGLAWWQMRRDRKEFRAGRVVVVALAAALGSLPFIAAWWLWTPRQTDNRSALLLAAAFAPTFTLTVWGIVHFGHRANVRKHDHDLA
jgi:hypothetical protein